MFTINLHNLIFFAHHGVHEEERILGNNFTVNVSLTFKEDEKISVLEQTVNYVSVYHIIKQRMNIPTNILETLTQELASEIYTFDNRIKSISVSVEKMNPPIANMQGSVSVSFFKEF